MDQSELRGGTETMDCNSLLQMGVELGRGLMLSGAEIYRVEESIDRLMFAYGQEADTFVLPNCIFISFTTEEGVTLTKMRRIPPHGTDIKLLEECNALCRKLCIETPSVEDALEQVRQVTQAPRKRQSGCMVFAYTVSAAFFCLFFGGGFQDFLCAAACGFIVGVLQVYCAPILAENIFLKTIGCSAVVSALAILMVHMGWGDDLGKITIGGLMLLVPGMALTNAMREIMAGDIMAGVHRTAEVLLVATAIALGSAIPIIILQSLVELAVCEVPASLTTCIWAFCACLGFGFIFNIHGDGNLICGFGGGIGWLFFLLVRYLGVEDILAAFLSAMMIAGYSELMSRIRHCPVTGYLQVALLPLVPGAGIYYTMQRAINGNTQLFIESLLHTFGIALALSVGAVLVSSVVRTVLSWKRKTK